VRLERNDDEGVGCVHVRLERDDDEGVGCVHVRLERDNAESVGCVNGLAKRGAARLLVTALGCVCRRSLTRRRRYIAAASQ
jgi:hypothetical protein